MSGQIWRGVGFRKCRRAVREQLSTALLLLLLQEIALKSKVTEWENSRGSDSEI